MPNGVRRLTCLVAVFLLTGYATTQAAAPRPDSLAGLGLLELLNGNTDSARTLFTRVLAMAPDHISATFNMGRIALRSGKVGEAKSYFTKAEKLRPKKGLREFGEGLILLTQGKKKTKDAKAKLLRASSRDRKNADMLVEIGKMQSGSVIDRFASKRSFRRAGEIAPRHPSALYHLGYYYDIGGDTDKAIDLYEKQLRVNPYHPQTLIQLGLALIDKERYWHARQRLYEALQRNTGKDTEITLAIAATYMGSRQFELANNTYAQSLRAMATREREEYEDISDIASVQEARYFKRIAGDQRTLFLKRFWLQRDPTPITPANERLLEHFRRVWYSKRMFSNGMKPWDDRGTVYIRWGEPTHRSSSRKPNFTVEAEIGTARERLLTSIYGADIPTQLNRPGMPAYPLIDPEVIKSSESYGTSMSTWTSSLDADDAAKSSTEAFASVSTGDMDLKHWEEWTYVRVSGGLPITFVDRVGNGAYRFAQPPTTTNSDLIMTLRQFSPSEQVAEARKDTPELYIYDINMKAFPFHYYVTQFRSDKKGGTLLDIYYGLPTSELIFKQETPTSYKATVENGFALFDTLWNVKGRIRNRVVLNSKGRPDQRAGSIHVDKLSMLLRGGQRAILSVQAKDVNSGRVEAYQQKLEVAKFDSVTLAMSDLVLAGSIAKADSTSEGKFVRNGLVILPMASRSFRRGQKIHVYFEVYNLGRGKTYGETEYEVEHAIRQGGKFSRGTIIGTIGRFLGGSTQSVGVTRIIKGLRSSEFQDFTLDSSTMPSGAYTLIITVRDLKSGNSVTKEQPIWIGT